MNTAQLGQLGWRRSTRERHRICWRGPVATSHGATVGALKEAYEDISQIFSDYAGMRRIAARSGGAEELLGAIREHEEEIDIAFLEEETPRAFPRSIDGIRKVSRIVSGMKAFARPGSSEMAPSDINKAITTTPTVARGEYRYMAENETDLAEPPPVTCHMDDINEVLFNIIVNAARVIEAKVGSGTEMGSLAIVSWNEPDVVLIEISDSGGEIWFKTEEGERNTVFMRLPKSQTESYVGA